MSKENKGGVEANSMEKKQKKQGKEAAATSKKDKTGSSEKVQQELEDARTQLKEKEDTFLRLYAEFENFRRRTARERIELLQNAGESTIITFIPVLDDLERAIKNIPAETPAAVQEGLKLIHAKFVKTLESQGVKPMDSVGKPFDPEKHDAITHLPAPNAKQKGHVLDETEKGYYLNQKVLRHAKVVVGS